MTEPQKPIEFIQEGFTGTALLLAFILGAIAVAVAVEFMHRSLPEHHDDAA